MSEPVGNSPRRDIVPGNSISDREAKAAEAAAKDRPEAEKLIEGVATVRKPSWVKRATRTIFAEDLSSIGKFLVGDLIIPTIRNSIYEIGVGALSRGIWGAQSGPARRMGAGPMLGATGNVSTISTRYDKMSEGSRVLSREARAKHDFDEVIFATREEAITILEGLVMRIERYRVATVADFYNSCGVTSGDFTAIKWGWTDLNSAVVRQRYGGWLLDLPAPEPLGN